MSTSKKRSWDSKIFFFFYRCFSSLKVDLIQENLIKERHCQSEKLFQEMLFFHKFAYNLVYIKVTINIVGSYVCVCVSFRDFKTPILELDVCKKCVQTYWRRGVWPQSFGLTVLLRLWKPFSSYVTKKYFLNSGILRLSEDFILAAGRIIGKIA